MKKAPPLPLFVLLFSVWPAPLAAKDSPKAPDHSTNWSGNWVLDLFQSKNLPQGLDSYSMTVEQDEQQLKVDTSLQGDLHPRDDGNGPYPSGGPGPGYPGGGGVGIGVGLPGGGAGGVGYPRGGGYPGGVGYPDDDGRYPGGPVGSGRSSRAANSSRAAVTALRMYPSSAVYKLDGTESTVELGDSEQTEATSKAEWAKNGLKLSLAANAGQRGGSVQLKDLWKLSKDGQYLTVDRSVRAPEGSGSLRLVFRRQPRDSGGASPAPSK